MLTDNAWFSVLLFRITASCITMRCLEKWSSHPGTVPYHDYHSAKADLSHALDRVRMLLSFEEGREVVSDFLHGRDRTDSRARTLRYLAARQGISLDEPANPPAEGQETAPSIV